MAMDRAALRDRQCWQMDQAVLEALMVPFCVLVSHVNSVTDAVTIPAQRRSCDPGIRP
jgi:hypothetical protein